MNLSEIRARAERVCTAYNRQLAASFEQLAEGQDERLFERADFVETIQRECMNAAGAWFERYDEALGFAPAEFIDALQSDEEFLTVYDICAAGCDSFLPETFQIALGRRREALLPALYERALACPLDDDAEEVGEALQIQCVSLGLLGQWEESAFALLLLEKILVSGLLNELLADAIKAYFTACGKASMPALIAALERALEAVELPRNTDYLLIYLTELGKDGDNRAYPLLRSAFKKMNEKVIAIICLGDLGDGRAVPLLRSFLERNIGHLDRQIMLETFSSIKRLGGLTDDLKALIPKN